MVPKKHAVLGMSRGRLPTAYVLVLTFGAFLLFHPFAFGRELHREVTCYNDVLHLDCGKSVVAIREAYFTTAKHENQTCRSPVPEHDYIEDEDDAEPVNDSICYEDIRISLNRKCSGFKSCNYSYSQQQQKNCYSPQGMFVVQYDCVKESNVNKWCNAKILEREGYISSPGYPQYYPELNSCSWQITASEGQTILVSILDIHLREATDVTPTMTSEQLDFHVMGQLIEQVIKRCFEDRLSIMEGTVKRFEVCGEGLEGLKMAEVDGVAGLELRFRTVAFMPAKGFLAYFKVQGCPTLAPNEDSYLVERNGSAAVYACRNNQVFNDSLATHRFLKCIRDHHWNDTLPHCIAIDSTSTTITMVSSTGKDQEFMNLTMAVNEKIEIVLDKNASLVIDIVIPTLIIGILLISNGIVLVVIFMVRRRQKPLAEEFEELRPTAVNEIADDSPNASPKQSEAQPSCSKDRSPQSSPDTQPSCSKEKSPQSIPKPSGSSSPKSQPSGTKEVAEESFHGSPKESESHSSIS